MKYIFIVHPPYIFLHFRPCQSGLFLLTDNWEHVSRCVCVWINPFFAEKKIPFSFVKVLDSLNLTWIGLNWKNALFINAHGDRKRNIKRLSDSCQIIELRPNPSFFVSGRVGLVLQSRTKSGSWKNLWMRSLSFITPCLSALQCSMF